MAAVIWVVLDGVGAGAAPDAALFGDAGSDTLGHILEARRELELSHLRALGLYNLYGAQDAALGSYGRARELSMGKDTTTGHWEMMGPVREIPFPTYPQGFPGELMERFSCRTGRGTLGNIPASGTQIIEELGEEQLRTGKLIVYTSADSVFQIAAHESSVSREELYGICRQARELLTGEHAVARVIARPFAGEPGHFYRTDGRHDFSLEPPYPMLLDRLAERGIPVTAIGKIQDIYCGRGIARHIPTSDNGEGLAALEGIMEGPRSGLIMANLVDFDMLYGHRRDVDGFARALEEADRGIGRILEKMGPEDTLILCADHGCDPTFRGSDHTRELVPVLLYGRGIAPNRALDRMEGLNGLGKLTDRLLSGKETENAAIG